MTGGRAALPMYDWPQVRDATDALWTALRAALRAEGIAAPERLTRGGDPEADWLAGDLVLGQTCGLPYVRRLAERAMLVGAADYTVPGCPPGWYRSAIVVRGDDRRQRLADFRGARLAINDPGSQSGSAAMSDAVRRSGGDRRSFGDTTVTGGHAASVKAVAGGQADIAAIDWVSWRLARVHLPEAAALRVLCATEPTPGLPWIAAEGGDRAALRRAAAAGIAALAPWARSVLGVAGFVDLEPEDYGIIAARAAGM